MQIQHNTLKEQWKERYDKSPLSILLLKDSINLLRSIESSTGCNVKIQEFISKIPEYDALVEDIADVKQILNEICSDGRDINSALAGLNYLHDVACSKAKSMLFIHEQFNCFF